MNKKYKLLATNTTVFAIGNILVKLISFFLMPIYTSVLTTAQYGVAELLNNTVEIVLPIATLCIVEALYRFAIDVGADQKTLFVNSFGIIIIGDIIVGIGCVLWFYVFDYQYALYFFVLYVATTFYKVTTQFARGLGHIKRYVLYGVLNSLLLVGANTVLLVLLHGGVASYLMAFVFGYGISGCIALICSKEYAFIDIKKISVVKLKEMLKYSLPSIPNMLSWWVNSLSDRYIVLYFLGASVAGLYTAASKLPAIMNLITSIFQQAWQYSTTVEMDSEGSKEFFSNVFRVYSYYCIVICSVLVLANKIICKVMLQSEFYEAWRFVPLLLLAAAFGGIATYFGTFYNALKNNTMLMVSTLMGAVGNVILNLTLIPTLGGMGAAIATAISYCMVMVIRMINIRKYVELSIDVKRFIFQIVLLFIAAVFGCFYGRATIIVTFIVFAVTVLSDLKVLKNSIGMIAKLLRKILGK